MARAALTLHHQSLTTTSRYDALLWSVNRRLGALLAALAPDAPDPGGDLEPLDDAWIAELAEMARLNAEAQEEAMEQMRKESPHGG